MPSIVLSFDLLKENSMSGKTDLKELLSGLSPILLREEYIFTAHQGGYGDFSQLEPLAFFQEKEAMTLIIPKEQADKAGIAYESSFRCITLQVHSSLEAVGLTAAVSHKLAQKGISANVVAAFYHDHVFVPSSKAQDALKALEELK